MTIARHFSAWSWSFHSGSGEVWYQVVLFGLSGVSAVALLLGFETRLASIVSWLLLVSLHNRVPPILSGADNLLRMLLFWGLFLPLGARWSIDARLARLRGDDTARRGSVLSVASAAILFQMAWMYLFSAVFKTNADWLEGRALAEILPNAFYGSPIAIALLEYPTALRWATFAVLGLEWIGPVLLFVPWRTGLLRGCVVGLLATMHIGIAIALNVDSFSYVSLAGLLLFLPSSAWDGISACCGRSKGESAASRTGDSVVENSERSPESFRANAVAALALAFVLFANVNELPGRFSPWTPVPRFEPLTVSLGLGQKWDMFAEAPPRTAWVVAQATLVDGSHIDLLRDGAAVEWERPADPAAWFPNYRWRKCFREMSYEDARGYQVFREPVAQYLCRDWNRGRPANRRVADFVLVLCTEQEDPYGVEPAPTIRRESLIQISGPSVSEPTR